MGHPQVTKMFNEENLYSIRALVVVHILNFQRDLIVMRFIHIELICSTSKVDGVKVHIHVVCLLTNHFFFSNFNQNRRKIRKIKSNFF